MSIAYSLIRRSSGVFWSCFVPMSGQVLKIDFPDGGDARVVG